jgi:hypothetical protein
MIGMHDSRLPVRWLVLILRVHYDTIYVLLDGLHRTAQYRLGSAAVVAAY